jgi:hypothetical protein
MTIDVFFAGVNGFEIAPPTLSSTYAALKYVSIRYPLRDGGAAYLTMT